MRATLATVNLAQVAAAIEFTAPAEAENASDQAIPANDEVFDPMQPVPNVDAVA